MYLPALKSGRNSIRIFAGYIDILGTFIHLFNKYSLSNYYVPGTILDGQLAVKENEQRPCLHEASILDRWGEKQ